MTLSYQDAPSNPAATASSTNVRIDTTPPGFSLPANVVAEATSASGAVVTYSANANDAGGSGVANSIFLPDSGDTFPIGTTTVNASATDNAGNPASGSFTVTVQDTTAPVVAAHTNVGPIEATSATGAVVNYAAVSADDAVGVTWLTYSQNSGTTFPIGTTTVTMTAKDVANNTGTGTFTVTVGDTTAPFVTPPQNVTVEATSAAGAVVDYPAATASDAVGVASLAYSQASGTSFPFGTTTVTATAKDTANNTDTATFSVTVRDVTAPAITVPANVVVRATSVAGDGELCSGDGE